MAGQQQQSSGCGFILILCLLFGLASMAIKSCDPGTPQMSSEPVINSGPSDPYNTPEARRTREDIRRFERDHNLKPYEESW
jgi:hypothetical protein